MSKTEINKLNHELSKDRKTLVANIVATLLFLFPAVIFTLMNRWIALIYFSVIIFILTGYLTNSNKI